jgi:hypothetical protein
MRVRCISLEIEAAPDEAKAAVDAVMRATGASMPQQRVAIEARPAAALPAAPRHERSPKPMKRPQKPEPSAPSGPGENTLGAKVLDLLRGRSMPLNHVADELALVMGKDVRPQDLGRTMSSLRKQGLVVMSGGLWAKTAR